MNLYTSILWAKSGKCHVSCALSRDSTSEVKNNHEFDKILNSLMNEHDVLEATLDATRLDATGTTGMEPRDGRCGDMRVGLDSCHFATPQRLFETRCLLH